MTSIGKAIDPLYTIFEQHLFNFQDPNSDRTAFIEGVVKDYLKHLRKLGLSVPTEWEQSIFEELFFQVQTMLAKKIYGCQTVNEDTAKSSTQVKRRAKARYQQIERQADQRADQRASKSTRKTSRKVA